MKSFVFILTFIVISSCRKESTYVSKTYFINGTSTLIRVVPFYKGEFLSQKTIIINSKDKLNVLNKGGRGKGGGETFAEEISYCDSLRVIYNSKDSICHYNPIISSTYKNLRGIYFESSRSLYNRANYLRKILSEDKNSIDNEYTYIFSEQDILDAKK